MTLVPGTSLMIELKNRVRPMKSIVDGGVGATALIYRNRWFDFWIEIENFLFVTSRWVEVDIATRKLHLWRWRRWCNFACQKRSIRWCQLVLVCVLVWIETRNIDLFFFLYCNKWRFEKRDNLNRKTKIMKQTKTIINDYRFREFRIALNYSSSCLFKLKEIRLHKKN